MPSSLRRSARPQRSFVSVTARSTERSANDDWTAPMRLLTAGCKPYFRSLSLSIWHPPTFSFVMNPNNHLELSITSEQYSDGQGDPW